MHLTRGGPLLRYATEAVYPFYILHQTVIVVLGYYVVRWRDGLWGNYLLICGGSFVLIMAVYHLLVRPFALTRPPVRPEAHAAGSSARPWRWRRYRTSARAPQMSTRSDADLWLGEPRPGHPCRSQAQGRRSRYSNVQVNPSPTGLQSAFLAGSMFASSVEVRRIPQPDQPDPTHFSAGFGRTAGG